MIRYIPNHHQKHAHDEPNAYYRPNVWTSKIHTLYTRPCFWQLIFIEKKNKQLNKNEILSLFCSIENVRGPFRSLVLCLAVVRLHRRSFTNVPSKSHFCLLNESLSIPLDTAQQSAGLCFININKDARVRRYYTYNIVCETLLPNFVTLSGGVKFY